MDCVKLLNLAYAYAGERGYARPEYLVSSIQRDGDEYIVLFQGLSGQPGDHFSVYVDSLAEQAVRLVGGR